jgi:hypothetical protein
MDDSELPDAPQPLKKWTIEDCDFGPVEGDGTPHRVVEFL